jgi:ubiquinone/menaquinone biosynthesis C-methylase UbiE
MAHEQRAYLPAAGSHWALPLYDGFLKLLGGDAARRRLIAQAALQPDDRVLEVGCGTGTLLMALAKSCPGIQVTGLDPDPRALARAQRKADAANVQLRLDRGFADSLPYSSASFDRVFSCLMFHHLADSDERRRMLGEARRVLAPGGRLELMDISPPRSTHSGLARWLNSSAHLSDNAESRVLDLMQGVGLFPAVVDRGRMLALHTAYYEASATAALPQ